MRRSQRIRLFLMRLSLRSYAPGFHGGSERTNQSGGGSEGEQYEWQKLFVPRAPRDGGRACVKCLRTRWRDRRNWRGGARQQGRANFESTSVDPGGGKFYRGAQWRRQYQRGSQEWNPAVAWVGVRVL